MAPDSSAEIERPVRGPLAAVKDVSVDPIDELRRFLEHVDVGRQEGVDYSLAHFPLFTTERVRDEEVQIALVQLR